MFLETVIVCAGFGKIWKRFRGANINKLRVGFYVQICVCVCVCVLIRLCDCRMSAQTEPSMNERKQVVVMTTLASNSYATT